MTRRELFSIRYRSEFDSLVDGLMLTERQRRIARLRYCDGRTNEEIAGVLNVSLSLVKKEFRVIKAKFEGV